MHIWSILADQVTRCCLKISKISFAFSLLTKIHISNVHMVHFFSHVRLLRWNNFSIMFPSFGAYSIQTKKHTNRSFFYNIIIDIWGRKDDFTPFLFLKFLKEIFKDSKTNLNNYVFWHLIRVKLMALFVLLKYMSNICFGPRK